jgi:ribosomal protein L44E
MSYVECMHSLCRIGLEIVQERAKSSLSIDSENLSEFRQRLETLTEDAVEHLQQAKMCKSMRDQLEHWNLRMHRSYIMSELFRPVLTRTEKEVKKSELLVECTRCLTQTVFAFLNLERVSSFAKRSWAAVHRTLSSALLLCITGETKRAEATHALVGELIDVMSGISQELEPSEIPTPISRSIKVLQRFVSPRTSSHGQDENGSTTSPSASLPTSWNSSSETSFSPYSTMNDILWGGNRGGML